MEVDHFNPTIKGKPRNFHQNLTPACRLCNNTKLDNRPTRIEESQGLRFLNPYKETDYGTHIFEDPKTGILHGTTPAGKWHTLILGLNDDHLVKARLRRTRLLEKFTQAAIMSGADSTGTVIKRVLSDFESVTKEILATAIPILPHIQKA